MTDRRRCRLFGCVGLAAAATFAVLLAVFLQPAEGAEPIPVKPIPVALQVVTNARLTVDGQNCQVITDIGPRIVNLRVIVEGMLQISGGQVIVPADNGGILITFEGKIPANNALTFTVIADDRPPRVVGVPLEGTFLAVARVTPPIVTFTTGPVIELSGPGFKFRLGDRTVSTGPWKLTALDSTLLKVMIGDGFPQIGWTGRIEAETEPTLTFANVSACELTGAGQRLTVVKSGSVDIKPGIFPNPINPSGEEVVPVAILGSAGFDVRTIDVATIEIDDDRLPGGGVAPTGDGRRIEDVNGDGFLDLLLRFGTTALNQAGLLGNRKLFVTGAVGGGAAQVLGADLICLPGSCAL